MPDASPTLSSGFSDRQIIVAIVLVTLVAFAPSVLCGYIWDDDDYVFQNALLSDSDGLMRIWLEPTATPQYYPLVHTTYWLEFRLWGLNPSGYHVVNLLLHTLTSVLLYGILRRLQLPGAWLAALFFAVHPVQVESVVWIAERKNVMSGFFAAASLFTYLRAGLLDEDRSFSWGAYLASLGLFLLALLSKTVVATLPAVILLLAFWKKGKIAKADLLCTLPMFVVGASMGLMTAYLESQHVGAAGAAWQLSPLERVLIAGRAVCFYLWTILWPFQTAFSYARWTIDTSQAWQYLYPAAVLTVLVTLFAMRNRWGRGPFVAFSAYAGMLFPALGFLNVYPHRYSFVADHFQYHACAAILALISATIIWTVSQLVEKPDRPSRLTTVLVGLCCIIPLAGTTFLSTATYQNEETLYLASIARSPAGPLAHNNLGFLYLQGGAPAEARRLFERCVEIHALDEALYLSNIGLTFAIEGDWPQAEGFYRKAIDKDPQYADAHANLAAALIRLERNEEAVAAARRAVEIQKLPRFFFILAEALAFNDQRDQAVKVMQDAVVVSPEDAEVHFRLAKAFAWQQRRTEAIAACREAIERFSGEPQWYVFLSQLHIERGEYTDAIEAAAAGLEVAQSLGLETEVANISRRLRRYEQQRLEEAMSDK